MSDPLSAMAGVLEISATVRAGRITPGQSVEAALARIERDNPRLNALTRVLGERARRSAAVVARRLSQGETLPLAGVPFVAKDLFDVAGLVTRAGSVINDENAPAAHDACAIAKLERAGAVLVGLSNMDEYAFGFTTENSHYGPTRNPHDESRVAGGSSGGSAAAVAGGLVPAALGSDTNGSIRVPAGFCGICGLKPTMGRLSRRGAFLFSPSLDHVGPMARNVADLAALYDALQGHDSGDPGNMRREIEPTLGDVQNARPGLKSAVARGWFEAQADIHARMAVETAATTLGAKASLHISLAEESRAAAALITYAEAGAQHLGTLRRRPGDLDPLIRDRLVAGALTPAVWVQQAQRVRRLFAKELAASFGTSTEVIIAPATPCTAPPIGVETVTINGVAQPMRPAAGLMTQPLTPSGFPIAVVPVTRHEGLPLGVQIIAPPWREDLCLHAAAALEAGLRN